MTDSHIQFATDWANIVLKNFVLMCAAQAKQALEKAKQEQPENKVIIGG